ncbi:Muniscin C-terminal mu homology domain-containing protein [Geranomyces variabilis]|nr:Muniscin C-terminal mu homology domain-containing protein [Geranomyces variabilis]KAJ3136396.1 hypothetical protein HDU90_003103 [Geranomyces variabilis]
MAKFVDSFSFEKPKESADLISKRLKAGQQLDDELANYFKDRAGVEEKYASELVRLAKKHTLAGIDKDFAGTFPAVWAPVSNALNEVAALHASYARELIEKMERPLRGRPHADSDWAKLKQYELEFGRGTKDYDDKIVKYLKAVTKAKKGAPNAKTDKKVSDALAAKDAARDAWIPQANEAFERFQRMDESRLMSLKETLSKYADAGVRHELAKSGISDGVLAATMTFDVGEDVEKFCASKGNNDGTGHALPPNSNSAATSRENSIPQLPDLPAPAGALSAAAIPTVDEEGYTIPPAPVSASWDAPGGTSLDEEENNSGTVSRIKVAIREKAIEESPDDADKALRQFQNVLGPSTTRLAKRGSRRISFSENGENAVGKRMTVHLNSPLNGAEPSRSSTTQDVFGGVESPTSFISPSLEPMRATPSSRALSPAGSVKPARISATIAEQVNVLIRGNEVEKLLLMGELSIGSATSFADLDNTKPFHFTIVNFEALAQAVPNETFCRVSSPDRPDRFECDPKALKLTALQAVPVIKYQVRITDATKIAPLMVYPIWKCEAAQTSLLLQYQLNPSLSTSGSNIELADVSFLVPVEGGGELGRVQTKPSGIWNADRKAILWKIGQVGSEGAEEPHKLLARIESSEPCRPGSTVAVRFTCAGSLLSGIDITFTPPEGDAATAIVELGDVTKTVTAGKYGAI